MVSEASGRTWIGVAKTAVVTAAGITLSACSNDVTTQCVDVLLGPVPLSVPQRNLTPTTPTRSSSGNFIFQFAPTGPSGECAIGCKDLFVTVTYRLASTPAEEWRFRRPRFTGRTAGNYKVYLDRFAAPKNPLQEILVPKDIDQPEKEFYGCDTEGRFVNPLCEITVETKRGLVAQFLIPRKVLGKARDATKFVIRAIDQLHENYLRGTCEGITS